MPFLVGLGLASFEDLGGNETLDQVVVAPVALPAGNTHTTAHEQGLQDGPRCARRLPPPVDRVVVLRESGDLIGEVTVLSGEQASATVILSGSARFWCAPASVLRPYLDTHEEVRHALEQGFAIALDDGLIAPALLDCRTRDIDDLAHGLADLVERTIAAPIDELVTSGQVVEVAAGALLATDRLEREIDFLSQAIEAVERAGSQAKFGTYSYCRAWPLYYMGRLDESIADAQAALSAHELGWETFYPATCSILAWAHLERGEIEAAERVIDIDHDRWGTRLDYRLLVPITRGRIALERGRYDDAVAEFELAREGGIITGLQTPVPPDWRTWLAITLTRLGRAKMIWP